MEQAIWDEIDALQSQHWYHVGTKEFIQSYIADALRYINITNWLDVGCGGGRLLQRTDVSLSGMRVGLEYADAASTHWQGGFAGVRGDAQMLPFQSNRFQLITAFDVIEHVPADESALAEIYRVLAPGGSLLLMVPCHQSLWSVTDERLGHYRRYRPSAIINLVRRAFHGTEPQSIRYINNLLFAPAYSLRWAQRRGLFRAADDHLGSASMPHPWLNAVLLTLFRTELKYLAHRMPVGIGIFIHAMKSTDSVTSSTLGHVQ